METTEADLVHLAITKCHPQQTTVGKPDFREERVYPSTAFETSVLWAKSSKLIYGSLTLWQI